MNVYLCLKWLHILSSVLLVGVGFGSAFYLYFINRTRNVAAIAEVSRLVIRADYWFTTLAVLVQPATGATMVYLGGYGFDAPWLWATYALFVVAGASWLPVVWLQIQMAKMARTAFESQTDLPPRYWRYAQLWERLGMVAFPATLVVYGLMVFKPTIW
ncbi:MAG: DUF2269 domain-containing protein [Gallionella sp.]